MCSTAERHYQEVGILNKRWHQLDGDVLPEHAAQSLELAPIIHVYADMATKFFEHFVYIAKAMNSLVKKMLGFGMKRTSFFMMY